MSAKTTRLRLMNLECRLVPTAFVDLTAAGSSGTAAGAIFVQSDAQPTGTGHIHSFLRIQGASSHGSVQQGYNTDARPLQFDENKSPNFTRSLPLSEVPVVNRGGQLYREFLLDINQKSSQPLLSLDELRIYIGSTPNASGYDSGSHMLAGMAPVFDLDGTEDNAVLLDYRLNSGSGSGDMLMYVPDSLFVGGSFVYVYSKFGVNYASNAGFQEWSVGTSPLTAIGATISGMKFNDLNFDGIKDPNEPGLANWVIFLDTNGNDQLDIDEVYTITDATGHYSFTNLAVGPSIVYRVREVQQIGWINSTTPPDDIVFLSPLDSVSNVDFGNHIIPN